MALGIQNGRAVLHPSAELGDPAMKVDGACQIPVDQFASDEVDADEDETELDDQDEGEDDDDDFDDEFDDDFEEEGVNGDDDEEDAESADVELGI